MKIYKVYQALFASLIVTLMALSSSAYAIPAMDVELGDLLPQAGDVKESLNLTPNQRILWGQVESKMRAIAEERRRRRDHLQTDLKNGVADSKTELRDLAKKFDLEANLSEQENKQLRELFLTVNDALDDSQRQKILVLLSEQLQRVPDQVNETKCEQPKSRSLGRQRSGGVGGSTQQ
jgi:hypothetical protein